MAKKSSKKKSKKSSKKKSSKSSKKSTSKSQKETPPPEGCSWCRNELEDEHRVLSHLMYILFLFATGFAAIFTIILFTVLVEDWYAGIKALVLLGWAFLFKTFAHRIHVPHH